MACEVLLPQWSMGMQDGELLRWLKAPGDAVAEGEVLAEVESSKTVGEVTAPQAGVFLRALVAEGTVVAVRTPLCLIGESGETLTEPAADFAVTARPIAGPVTGSGPAGARVEITPVARKLAREHGLDVAELTGSGPGGRIVEADVRARLVSAPLGSAPGTGYSLRAARGAVAQRLVQSLAGSAQLTLTRELDLSALAALRVAPVGWTELIAYALSRTLPAHPRLNGTITGDWVQPAADVDLGFAVALADGLVVPVIRGAQSLSLAQLAAACGELARRARAGALTQAEQSGGSFTLSNLGAYGIDAFTPIINPPQIAILGIGRVRDVPVREGAALAWRQSLVASLTFDHRVTDGAPAALLLRDLAAFLAAPERFV